MYTLENGQMIRRQITAPPPPASALPTPPISRNRKMGLKNEIKLIVLILVVLLIVYLFVCGKCSNVIPLVFAGTPAS